MGMQNPAVSEPIDKLAEVFPEGTPFFLLGIRVVKAKTTDFGEGEMVILKVRGHDRELGVWGSYLLTQAKSADVGDMNQWYTVERRVIDGFGKGRPVKVFTPATAPDTAKLTDAPTSEAAPVAAATDEDIPS